MRLKEGAHLLGRGQFAVNQLQKDGMHNLAVAGQFRGDPHLLHEGVWDASGGLPAKLSGTG